MRNQYFSCNLTITDIEDMLPFEREIYLIQINNEQKELRDKLRNK